MFYSLAIRDSPEWQLVLHKSKGRSANRSAGGEKQYAVLIVKLSTMRRTLSLCGSDSNSGARTMTEVIDRMGSSCASLLSINCRAAFPQGNGDQVTSSIVQLAAWISESSSRHCFDSASICCRRSAVFTVRTNLTSFRPKR